MRKLIDDSNDIWFSCGCQDWRITNEDEKRISEIPSETFMVHDCQKISVFQRNRSVRRYFLNKLKV